MFYIDVSTELYTQRVLTMTPDNTVQDIKTAALDLLISLAPLSPLGSLNEQRACS